MQKAKDVILILAAVALLSALLVLLIDPRRAALTVSVIGALGAVAVSLLRSKPNSRSKKPTVRR